MHHGSLEQRILACPLKALAILVAHIWVHTSYRTTRLCAYWESVSRGDVMDRYMIFHVEFVAEKLDYPSSNIPLDRTDTHSNRAGGACAMKLEGFDDESIGNMVI